MDRQALGLTEEDEDIALCLKTVALRAVQSRALNALRQACLRFWKRKTVRDLCAFLGSDRKAWSPKRDPSGAERTKLTVCGTHKFKGRTVGIRKWSPNGRASYTLSIQDGTRLWIHKDKLPKYRRPQRDVVDASMKKPMVAKLLKVRNRCYFEEGLVEALTTFFGVLKGEFDIRIVYDGTASGLNEALWAPWFSLPTVSSHLRVVEPGTYMADVN